MVARENYKRCAPGRTGIIACTTSYSKMVAVSELREIARVAYLGQITNIGSRRVWKLYNERSWEGRDISVHVCAREKGYRLRISWNRTCSTFRPNNEYWKQSRLKNKKWVLPRGPGYTRAQLGAERGCRLRIVRNHTGSIFRPNNEYRKRSRAKIRKAALLGGPGYLRAHWACEKGCRFRIVRNRMGSIFRPYHKYWMWSRAKNY